MAEPRIEYDVSGFSPTERRMLSALKEIHLNFGVQVGLLKFQIERLATGEPERMDREAKAVLARKLVREAARDTVEFLNEKFPDIGAKIVRR